MESPIKQKYDDALLEGAFEGAYLTDRYGAIIRLDNLSYQYYPVG